MGNLFQNGLIIFQNGGIYGLFLHHYEVPNFVGLKFYLKGSMVYSKFVGV